MKFIPLDSFEYINSLLQGVEAQGCLLTIQLAAFTCRHTREEKQIAENLVSYYANVQSTPPISPSPIAYGEAGAASTHDWPDALALPPPHALVLGSSAPAQPSAPLPLQAQDIDERLLFLVAALNNLYQDDGYDFSVLSENDFVYHDEAKFRSEMNLTLGSLPTSCQPAVQRFWAAVEGEVLDAAQGCEYYEFSCPSCDPRAETSLFSHHYFLYNKRRKVLVSMLLFAEGNQYRGDDGYYSGQADPAHDAENDESRHYMSTPEPMEDEEEEYSGKNRDFYGY